MKPEAHYNTFLSRIRRLQKRELTIRSTIHLIRFLVIFGSFLLFGALLESIFWFPVPYRLILSGTIAAAGFGFIIYYGYSSVRAWLGYDKRFSFESLTLKVGKTFPEIRDKLLNAIQVFAQLSSNKERYSPALVTEAMNRAGASFGSYDFTRSINYSKFRRQVYYLGLFMAIALGLSLLSSGALSNAVFRISQPAREFPIPALFSLEVTPGNAELIRNEPFAVNAALTGKVPDNLNIFIKPETGFEYETSAMQKTAPGLYEFQLEKVKESFEYFIRAPNGIFLSRSIDSDRYTVTVINRPMVRKLKLHLDFPVYSRLGSRYLEDNIGDVAALKGTQARMELALNKPVQEAALHFSDGSIVPFSARGITAVANFTIQKNVRYTIHLTDIDGITNSEPIEYRVTAIQDASPYVQFTIPGEDTDLTEDKQVPIVLKISDDFGLTRLRLGYRLIDRDEVSTFRIPENLQKLLNDPKAFSFSELPLENKQGLVREAFYLWNLKNVQIFPEDQVIYFAEIFDNDRVAGPKRSRTKAFTLRLPSIIELFSKAAEIQEMQEENLTEILDESKELQQKLTEIFHEFNQSKGLEWEQIQKAEEAIKKQRELQNKIGDIKNEIEELINKFEQNDLLSAETLDKYKELQELLKELALPDMQNIMKNLQESMENTANMNQNRKNVENMRDAQKSYMDRVERTLNILKRLQIEQMMDEVVTKSENITETQETINTQMDSLAQKSAQEEKQSDSEKNRLSRQEQDLAKNVDDLQETLDRLLEKMIEQPDFSPDKLGKALENMEQKELSQKMLKMSREMFMEALNNALESGKQIEKELKEIEQELQDAQQDMQQNQKDEVLRALRKSAFDLLEISNKQEELKSNSSSLTTNSDKFRQVADAQNNMMSGLTRATGELVRLSEKTFFITPELGRNIGESLSSMQESIKMLEARNKAASITSQDKSLRALNESVNQLRNIIQSAEESGSGIGFNEFMEQMEQMAGQQQQLNQNTLEMSKNDALTLEQQAAMQRLMQDQDLLRKSIEQIQKEIQDRTGVSERLGRMSDEMQEIVKDLRDQNITDRTLDLQERILSQMLDAQRSVHRRDFSRKRIAETAKFYEGIDPGKLPANLGEQKRYLEEDLIRALKEGYNRDFEELIKKYFDILNRKNVTAPVIKH